MDVCVWLPVVFIRNVKPRPEFAPQPLKKEVSRRSGLKVSRAQVEGFVGVVATTRALRMLAVIRWRNYDFFHLPRAFGYFLHADENANQPTGKPLEPHRRLAGKAGHLRIQQRPVDALADIPDIRTQIGQLLTMLPHTRMERDEPRERRDAWHPDDHRRAEFVHSITRAAG
jgi:hypothetical protein